MSVIKKPYEISLWEDALYWVRVELQKVSLTQSTYKIGQYYSQNANVSGSSAVPYTLDYGVFTAGRDYYKIKPSGRKKEGPEASDTELTEGEWGSAPSTVFTYYKEIKLCTIGTHNMDAPIRATKPKFVSKISGENTLTFTVYSHYWDEDEQKLAWNPFMMYLTNERKVKLKYDEKWYDFVIKNISEDSSSKAFTYTCKDLFVNELSKTGFEIEFDNELKNNMGTLQYLAEKVLEDSDWSLKSNIETVLQYLEEPLYEATFHAVKNGSKGYLPSGMQVIKNYGATNQGSSSEYDQVESFPYGKKVYIFYNSINNKLPTLQFLYDPSGTYKLDDKNVVIGYSANTTDGVSNFTFEGVTWKEETINGVVYSKPYVTINSIEYALCDGYPVFDPERRGERIIKSQKTIYDPKIDRVVKIYNSSLTENDGKIYGYEDTDYISPSAVQSYVANASEFTNKSGWYVGKYSDAGETYPDLNLKVYPELTTYPELQGNTLYIKIAVTSGTFNANKPLYYKNGSGIFTEATSYTSGTTYYKIYSGKSYLEFIPTIANQVTMNTGIQNNRTTIKKFTIGEKYILNLIAYKNLASLTRTSYNDVTLQIFEYELNNGIYSCKKKNGSSDLHLFNITRVDTTSNTVGKCMCTCNYSLSEEEFKNTKIGIFIVADKANPIFVEKMEFYPYKTYINSAGQTVECAPGDDLEAQIKTMYCYYDKDSNYTSAEDLELLYEQSSPSPAYSPYYGSTDKPAESYEKVRSITAKESNRFNLLQTLCELFQCWVRFEVEHDENSGHIKLDANYRQLKWVTYQKYIGEDNYRGFKYGVNLKSIKRTLDSNGSISKIIVKNNSNEIADNGFCSIARALENPTGENFIYNFDYYVGQGLINFSTLNLDLYCQPGIQGYLGYYKSLKAQNEIGQEKAATLAELLKDIANYDSQYQTYKLSSEAAAQDKTDQEINFYDLTGVNFEDALPEYQPYNSSKHKPANAGTNWYTKKDLTWEFYSYDSAKGEYTKLEDVAPGSSHYARLKWWDNSEAQKIKAAISRDIIVQRDHKIIYENQKVLKDAADLNKLALEQEIKTVAQTKLDINKNFYKKYSRFIQEGSWIKEDYYDDNLYYIDALSTLYTSSRPQVKYTIDVVEVSQLEDYEDLTFALGDKTYIEDKEFFGYSYDGQRLYREEVIVTEVSVELDQPESNKITVQNYKTQFEDLFQRVVATTQQIQFSTGEYKRGAAIVQPGGIINPTSLQNSFLNNAITIQNAKDQSVIIGDDGITTTNLSKPSEMLRIISGGVFISGDGGVTWTTGISAGGINANCITTGQLNVSEVNITMGQNTAFRWDSLGISAFQRNENGINPGAFTRFDQFGLYGINGSSNFDPLNYTIGGFNTAIDYIKDNASFGLTWDKFWLRSSGTEGYVSIDSERDFEVIRITEIDGEETEVPIIKIGRLQASASEGNSDYYGIRISDLSGNAVLETNQSGELWLRKKLSVQTAENQQDQTNIVQIGALGREDTGYVPITNETIYSNADKVIDANRQFKVYANGHVEANDIVLKGGGYFKGTIEATGGYIGGLTIEEWAEIGFSLQITSSNGWVLREGAETTLEAYLYKGGVKCETNEVTWKETDGSTSIYSVEYEWTNEAGAKIGTGNTLVAAISGQNVTREVFCTATLTFERTVTEEEGGN